MLSLYLIGVCIDNDILRFNAAFSIYIVGITIWRDRIAKIHMELLENELMTLPAPVGRLRQIASAWVTLPAASTGIGLVVALLASHGWQSAQWLLAYVFSVLIGAVAVALTPKRSIRESWLVVVVWITALVICGSNV